MGTYADGVIGGPFNVNGSTISGQGLTAGAVTVGAANFRFTPECGTSPAIKEDYSSGGTPAPIVFAANGTRLATPVIRRKPEIVAPDHSNTSFFGDDDPSFGGVPPGCTDDDTFGNFGGTSAAAPNAAAAAALMYESKPTATTGQILNALQSTTSEMLTPGFDFETGYGLIKADKAAAQLTQVLTTGRFAAPVISGNLTSATPVPEGPAGTYRFTARLCSNSASATTNLLARTAVLTNGNSLISRTRNAPLGAPGGPTSEQASPLTAAYADELLTNGECTDQQYVIGLQNKAKFTFTVDFYGNVQ